MTTTQHIYVVDDEAPAREMVGDYLKLHGFDVTLCDGGASLRAAIARQSPDLIILDLNLPRRGGFDVLQTIRSKPSLVGVPVGILTSSDAVKDRHRIAVTGGELYIHKPPELEDFLEQVGQAVEDLLARRLRH